MTTIAWDGKTMASERMLTIGGTPVTSPTSKIQRLQYRGREALVGRSGSQEHGASLVSWLAAGCPADNPPVLAADDSENSTCAALLVTADGATLFSNSHVGVFIGPVPWAMGSGADYALGAMAAGASAKRAVEIASKLDIYSGFGVDVLTLEKPHARR